MPDFKIAAAQVASIRGDIDRNIESGEFESAWAGVQNAPNQPQQYDTSSWSGIPEALSHLTPEQCRRLPPWIARLFNDGD